MPTLSRERFAVGKACRRDTGAKRIVRRQIRTRRDEGQPDGASNGDLRSIPEVICLLGQLEGFVSRKICLVRPERFELPT
jgi:hypothetical protein